MASTNFAALQPQEKVVWARDTWRLARDNMFIKRFMGTDQNSMIQRITELTKTEKGEKAIVSLVADLVEDGVIGDNAREGFEEALQSYYVEIPIDQITHSVRNKGKLSDQKSTINFRTEARDKLVYWLANRVDQLAFLTLSGIGYQYKNNGAARDSKSQFPNLSFASEVTAPSTKRGLMWSGSALTASVTGSITSAYKPTYGMIVELMAYAKEHYVKPLMAGGKEYYVLVLHPRQLALLKQDADYQRAVVTGLERGENNPWFTGGTVTVDGAVIHEHRLTYNTKGITSGSKWGSGGTIDGARALVCGAQSLAMADLGNPEWTEKLFEYDSIAGINVDKMFGLKKPKFHSLADNSTEDFGVVTCDTYIP